MSHGLDRAVGAVSYPAPELAAIRFAHRKVAKAATLDLAFDPDVHGRDFFSIHDG
jgi:hypothetical protein